MEQSRLRKGQFLTYPCYCACSKRNQR